MSEMLKIPDGWESVELGKVATLSKGKGIAKKDMSDSGIDCIRYGELYTLYDVVIDSTFSKTSLPLDEIILSKKNDVLIPASGETAIDLATSSCVIRDGVAIGGDINIIRTQLDGVFLSYFINVMAKNEVANLAQGSSVIHLYGNRLKSLNICFPKSKSEQQKIAQILSEADCAISKTEALLEKNRRLKTALMQDLLSYGIDENDKIRNPKTHDFKPSPLGDIPMEWDTEKLGNSKLFTLKTGGTPATAKKEYWDDGHILWMSSGEVNNKVITDTELKITELGYKSSSATRIPKFSILMALAGQGKTRGTIAINHVELTTNQSVAAIICNLDKVLPQFLFYYLDSQYENLRNISYGAGRAGLSLSILKEIEIIFPPLPEQQKIADILSSQDEKIEALKTKLNKLKSLKASLMQDLLSGEKRVTKLMESN